jgi:hypothetical protein
LEPNKLTGSKEEFNPFAAFKLKTIDFLKIYIKARFFCREDCVAVLLPQQEVDHKIF